MDLIQLGNDNWIEGIKGKFKFMAKVFTVGSDFGLKNGRISKIQVCDVSQEHWGWEKTYLNYDRGWDIRPNDPEIIEFINGLLEAFGDDKLDGDDLMWYEVYGYHTEDDFENCRGRELLITENTMKDAMAEARGWLAEVVTYEVIKVISNDDEEIAILRKGD